MRVLPVVFFAVTLVGAFGWIVFTRYATEKLIQHDSEEVAFLVDLLRQKTLLETMALEARKADIAANDEGDDQLEDEAPAAKWSTDLLTDKYLVGVALVGSDRQAKKENAQQQLHSLSMVDSLRGPVNISRLATWFNSNRDYFSGDFQPSNWSGLRSPGAPVLANDSPWHPTYVFPPVLIEEVSGLSQASAGGNLAALLPVLVRGEDEQEDGFNNTIYFLSLDHMLMDLLGEKGLVSESGTWWCVVNYQGRVIDAANGAPTVGSLLENQHRSHAEGPFSVVTGAELVGDWELGDPWHNTLVGGHFNRWVVAGSQTDAFPLAILVGHKATELQSASLGYVIAVIGVALLALSIAIIGVTRVVGRVSTRLTALSQNMAEVAKGDYSRRIPTKTKDEVGRLIGYFNLMAVSLDETQRELAEKTTRLEASLENRQLMDRSKDDFLVLISHEVRTPLTAIMGGVNILKNQVGRVEGPDREVLDKLNVVEVVSIIESSGERLHGFMNDAIQMTSVQASDKELDLGLASIGGMVEQGLCGVREMAQIRNIDVVNGLEQQHDWQILCDAKIMRLAFEKVLKNSVTHNYDNGRVMIREVEEVPGEGRIAQQPRTEEVHRLLSQPAFERFEDLSVTWRTIEIFNTGEAIPPERCAALFGKFELVGRIEHHQRGSGLSMPIAQSAVESHGGRIYVHSVKLQGNSFFMLLPTVATADAEELNERQLQIEAHGRKILAGLAGNQQADGVSSRPGDKNISQVTDPTTLKVEFHHDGATVSRGSD